MMSHSDFSVEKVAAGEDFADLAAASRDLICSLNRGDGTEFHPKEQGSRKIATQLARTTLAMCSRHLHDSA
jgi:hypothetical protein